MGIYKINACLHIGRMVKYSGGKFGNAGIDFLCSVIESMFAKANVVIHDYMYIDESAFFEVIELHISDVLLRRIAVSFNCS